MVTFSERYQQGKCEEVWYEMMEFGDNIREEPYYTDSLHVARETMRRVRRNIEIIIPRLEAIGYLFGYDWAQPFEAEDVKAAPPRLGMPSANIQARLAELEQTGAIFPLSVRAFYEIVGAVNFVGIKTADVDRFEFGNDAIAEEDIEDLAELIDPELNPLYIKELDRNFTPQQFQRWRQEEEAPYTLEITQDAESKYFLAEPSDYVIEIPCLHADAQMLGEQGYDLTFVEYLRHNIRYGGLPGLPKVPALGEKALDYVTRELLPF